MFGRLLGRRAQATRRRRKTSWMSKGSLLPAAVAGNEAAGSSGKPYPRIAAWVGWLAGRRRVQVAAGVNPRAARVAPAPALPHVTLQTRV